MKIILTNREKDILRFICEGKSNKQMASLLHLGERTFEWRKQELYVKIGHSRLASVIVWAIENGYYEVNIKNNVVEY
jgi:DNA-binding NarL/FixJ family response regulator